MILALPRGGVPVASEVAAALNAPLDLVLVRKIGVPSQPELAMGAIVDGGSPTVIRNEDVIRLTCVDEAEFQAVCDRELAEIERRRQRYIGDRERMSKGILSSSSTMVLQPAQRPEPLCAPRVCDSQTNLFLRFRSAPPIR